jgi:glycosyltransferase involved in cell wall biosynthesis
MQSQKSKIENPKSKTEVPVSLIMTVRNEASSLPRLLDSILAQTVRPAEIVIADGGSTDGTQELIRSYTDKLPLRLIEMPGANISQGRNAAIQNASHDIIAATDGGVRLEPRWLEELTRPLLPVESLRVGVQGPEDENPKPTVQNPRRIACGFFLPDPQTPFEVAMGATVLPSMQDIDPATFLPSSRSVAFLKEAWQVAGGYPEWLDYCEDLVFDIKLKEAGYRFQFVPQAVVYFRPRSNLWSFFLQYYRYARGDGKADLWRKRHAIRYLTYLSVPLLSAWAWKNRRGPAGKLVALGIALTAASYCRRPYARLLPMLRHLALSSCVRALALVPLIRLVGDVAKMAGYPVGVWWRVKRTPGQPGSP